MTIEGASPQHEQQQQLRSQPQELQRQLLQLPPATSGLSQQQLESAFSQMRFERAREAEQAHEAARYLRSLLAPRLNADLCLTVTTEKTHPLAPHLREVSPEPHRYGLIVSARTAHPWRDIPEPVLATMPGLILNRGADLFSPHETRAFELDLTSVPAFVNFSQQKFQGRFECRAPTEAPLRELA